MWCHSQTWFLHPRKHWWSVKYACPVFKCCTPLAFCCLSLTVSSEVQGTHLFNFGWVINIWSKRNQGTSTPSHFQQGNLMALKMFFKGWLSGFLKNILYPLQFLLTLMFSLHLPFPIPTTPTATALSPQKKELMGWILPEEIVCASLWVTCNAVTTQGHAAACAFSARTDRFTLILFPFFM